MPTTPKTNAVTKRDVLYLFICLFALDTKIPLKRPCRCQVKSNSCLSCLCQVGSNKFLSVLVSVFRVKHKHTYWKFFL